jgi:hypothetical protein
MFYFFNRGSDYLRCEIREAAQGNGYEVVVTEPGKPERVESFATSDEAHAYWMRLQQDLLRDGWWGPHGRD